MDNDIAVRVQCLVIGFVAGAAFIMAMSLNFSIVPKYHHAKEVCEKDLPRNQVCVMTFVPE